MMIKSLASFVRLTCHLLTYLQCVRAAVPQFTYVGCFIDYWVPYRDLTGLSGASMLAGPFSVSQGNGPSVDSMNSMTIELCASICYQNGFSYFGMQYYYSCFCGNQYGKYDKTFESECSAYCTGNRYQICGGYYRNSIFMLQPSMKNKEYRIFTSSVTEVTFAGSWSDEMPNGYMMVPAKSRMLCLQLCSAKRFCQTAVYVRSGGLCYLMRLRGVTDAFATWPADKELLLPTV